MAQYARPNADDYAGNWTSTGSNLYGEIDETSASDSDYMSSYQPEPPDTCQISLGTVTDPEVNTDHYVRFRSRVQNQSMDVLNLTVELAEGGSPISNVWSGAVMWSSWQTIWVLVDSSDIENYLTDYSDLSLQFTAMGYAMDAGLQVDISWAELEVPDAPVSEDSGGDLGVIGTLAGRGLLNELINGGLTR